MGCVSRRELPREGEDVLSLPSGLFWCLVRDSVNADWCLGNDGEERSEKEVGTFSVEIHRQRSIELGGWDAEGYHGDRDGRAGNLGSWVGDGTEWWKVGAVCSEDNVVGWVEGNLVPTIRGGIAGLGGIDSEHVGGHLRGEVIDHDGELLRESW